MARSAITLSSSRPIPLPQEQYDDPMDTSNEDQWPSQQPISRGYANTTSPARVSYDRCSQARDQYGNYYHLQPGRGFKEHSLSTSPSWRCTATSCHRQRDLQVSRQFHEQTAKLLHKANTFEFHSPQALEMPIQLSRQAVSYLQRVCVDDSWAFHDRFEESSKP
ncbi:Hypothetical predicted protein [Lecanosticta acicola]|uniref:Uncharacterized protein n=1 Tax=Lecanosticta acicola TaxID=111012 RepID=A0AAI8Z587_9PEZI|nr:Hypothetical predicted protein [Lecanosticta acicola]